MATIYYPLAQANMTLPGLNCTSASKETFGGLMAQVSILHVSWPITHISSRQNIRLGMLARQALLDHKRHHLYCDLHKDEDSDLGHIILQNASLLRV